MFYSPTTGGFYSAGYHGARRIFVADPNWTRPVVSVDIQPGESITIDGEEVNNETDQLMTVDIPDMTAQPPLIEVDNPRCSIPPDAVEISDEYHAELLAGQQEGKFIVGGVDGYPVLQDPPPPTREQILRSFQMAHDAYINAPALARNYDSFYTFALRASRPGPWQAEGIIYYDWMEECNTIGFALLEAVRTGDAQPPESVADYLAMLPICPLDVPQ